MKKFHIGDYVGGRFVDMHRGEHSSLGLALQEVLIALRTQSDESGPTRGYRVTVEGRTVALVAPEGGSFDFVFQGEAATIAPVWSRPKNETQEEAIARLSPPHDPSVDYSEAGLSDEVVGQFMAVRGPMSVPQELGAARSMLSKMLEDHSEYWGVDAVTHNDVWLLAVKDNGDYTFQVKDSQVVAVTFNWGDN